MVSISRRQFLGGLGAGLATRVALGTLDLDPTALGITRVKAAPDPTTPQTWLVRAGIESNDHAVMGMVFLPYHLWVNVGDTVTWTILSMEFHTVTFLPPHTPRPPFNPMDPQQAQPQGPSHYDGKSYVNSGLLFQGQSFHLTFDVPGDFFYICLIHSMMSGVVHVRPAGTPYPLAQADYDHLAEIASSDIVRAGQAMAREAEDFARRFNAQTRFGMSNEALVIAGIGDGGLDLMRFYPETLVVRVGQVVTFVNADPEAPHTVTFGGDLSEEQSFPPIGVPQGYFPGQVVDYAGNGLLNSGYIGVDPNWFGTTFRTRFTQPGTYPYLCALHDMMGMKGTVIVRS